MKILLLCLIVLPLSVGLISGTSTATPIVERPGDFVVIPPPIENTIDCSTIPPSQMPFGVCDGTDKNDEMRGNSRKEHGIWAGDGDDYVLGGEGPQSMINGGNGNDLIYGGEGNDGIGGGNGTDRIYGGPGDDYIQVGTVIAFGNETDLPPSKDFVDCGEGYDKVVVDNLDMYENCEVANGFSTIIIDPNRDISNLTRFPGNNTMESNRDITNLTRFP
jgi:Ca2+-binding RTX toxin-like protein